MLTIEALANQFIDQWAGSSLAGDFVLEADAREYVLQTDEHLTYVEVPDWADGAPGEPPDRREVMGNLESIEDWLYEGIVSELKLDFLPQHDAQDDWYGVFKAIAEYFRDYVMVDVLDREKAAS